MLAGIAILLALAQSEIHLSIQPWTGADLQSTSASAAKYRLEVSGKANSTVRLQARGVAAGWLAAFCTPKLCSPQRIDVSIPHSGQAVFQFELIRESDSAPKKSGATIAGDGGAFVIVPEAYRQ
ncbi:MAG: hypothetical protein WA814_00725 [Candidatus Baltobacteraceae bacterium]